MGEDKERIVQRGPGEVIAGEDEIPREPAPPLDPYTPEPGPRQGEERAFTAMRVALVVLGAVVVALIVWAILG